MEEVKINTLKDDVISVKYKGKKVIINITRELSINEAIINSQLKDSPSNYAFLCLCRDKSIKERDIKEQNKNSIFSELWLYYKQSDAKMVNDAVTNRVLNSKKYQIAEEEFIKATYQANKLISICKAYESRERILQTISANLRKER